MNRVVYILEDCCVKLVVYFLEDHCVNLIKYCHYMYQCDYSNRCVIVEIGAMLTRLI